MVNRPSLPLAERLGRWFRHSRTHFSACGWGADSRSFAEAQVRADSRNFTFMRGQAVTLQRTSAIYVRELLV